jgi:hypothetical protein
VKAFRGGVAPELREAQFGYCKFETRTAQALRAAIREGCPRFHKRNDLRIYN